MVSLSLQMVDEDLRILIFHPVICKKLELLSDYLFCLICVKILEMKFYNEHCVIHFAYISWKYMGMPLFTLSLLD